jgi:prepilin-type N-terminal cleavage/methylation domain-containing protein
MERPPGREQRKHSSMKNNDEGFTLIELLIVIVILGILAAVVVFAVGGITNKGETSACKADKKTLEVAVEAYYAQEGSYPADQDTLVSAGFMRQSSDLYTVSGSTVSASAAQCTSV